MRTRILSLTAALAGLLSTATAAAAQSSGPPPVPEPRTQSGTIYVPLYGGTVGIAIPLGRLSDDHAAGYALGGFVEYAVSGQPYSLRGEALLQRFDVKTGHEAQARNTNLLAIGPTIVYRLQKSTAQTFVTGGIAIYNATSEGTRPGFNLGTGIEIPLTGFSASAEARAHVMLADVKPVIALPLTISLRF
jgi:hypothetical protein